MISGCCGGNKWFHMLSGTIKARYALGSRQLIRNMAVSLMLVLVANAQLTELEWDELEDQERFLYNQDEGRIVVLAAEPPRVRSA